MEVQDQSRQDQDGLADQVMDSLGVEEGSHAGNEAAQHEEHEDQGEGKQSDATLAVQKRLKAQKRAHEREVHALHARIGDLEARMSHQPISHEQATNPYNDVGSVGIDEQIHKAVSYALQHKEMEERKAHEAQQQAHVHRQYQEFSKHLDGMNDKYDDFHDVVFGNDTPYTPAMRDYALTLPRSGTGSAGEVLYKLGKNPKELERIARLHPLDQASEMARLSHALISGGEHKSASTNHPLGQIKSNPVTNSHAVTDKTPVGDIRQRMKSGSWK